MVKLSSFLSPELPMHRHESAEPLEHGSFTVKDATFHSYAALDAIWLAGTNAINSKKMEAQPITEAAKIDFAAPVFTEQPVSSNTPTTEADEVAARIASANAALATAYENLASENPLTKRIEGSL